MNVLRNMSPESFRVWCKDVGVRFNTDEDTGEIYTTQSLEDMYDFALTLLETFDSSK